jgi:hypothetical protein
MVGLASLVLAEDHQCFAEMLEDEFAFGTNKPVCLQTSTCWTNTWHWIESEKSWVLATDPGNPATQMFIQIF